jgi:peptidoglycan hydrolase FlgJ
MQLPPTPSETPRNAILRTKAEEMLSYTGMDKQSEAFNGGHGEEQFTSFLRQEHANAIVAKGGVGLAEQLFRSLIRHAGNAD